MNSGVSAQPKESNNRPTYFKGTFYESEYFCLVTPLTDVLIVSYRENEINKDRIINLENQVQEKQTEISAVDKELQASNNASAAKDSINDISEVQIELSRKEKQREKWRKSGEWIKDKWQEFTIGTSALAAGIGIGYVVK